MKQRIIKIEKLTNTKWLNLFKVQYINSKDKVINWFFSSRKKKPLIENKDDCVVIIPTIDTPEGRKIVLIKEYRVTIMGDEYGFPAGLIEDGQSIEEAVEKELLEETGLSVKKFLGRSNRVYSSPGMSDESSVIVFVEAEGELSKKYQETTEDIEPIILDIDGIRELLSSDKKIGAKTWGVLYYYSKIGRIE